MIAGTGPFANGLASGPNRVKYVCWKNMKFRPYIASLIPLFNLFFHNNDPYTNRYLTTPLPTTTMEVSEGLTLQNNERRPIINKREQNHRWNMTEAQMAECHRQTLAVLADPNTSPVTAKHVASMFVAFDEL